MTAPVSARATRAAGNTPLEALKTLLAADMDAVEDVISARMVSPVGRIPDVASHLIDAGGKRVRPLITVAAARLCMYEGFDHIKLAATVEFIHTATLLHDDVVDNSGLRRGRTSANAIFGNASSVLVGDFLFARAFNLMVETGELRVLDILSRASTIIAEGEVRQLAAANNVETSVATYREIIEAKTAGLFAAAAQVGAVIAGRPPHEEEALARYGRELGLAFQLVDDALDYGGLESTLGKRLGDDFREGKVTMPVALALRAASLSERAFWERVIAGEQDEGDFETALELMHRHGALAQTIALAREHGEAARDALDVFASHPIREALRALPEFVVQRAY